MSVSVSLLKTDPILGSVTVKFNNISPNFIATGPTYGSKIGSENMRRGMEYTGTGRSTELCENNNNVLNCLKLCSDIKNDIIPQNRSAMETIANCPFFNYNSIDAVSYDQSEGRLVDCWYDWQGACSTLDVSSFNLGSITARMLPYQQGVDWDVIDNGITPTVWADVIYLYDFYDSPYNKDSLGNGPSQLVAWLSNLTTPTKAGNISLTADIYNLIYNMVLTKALFTDFYNQLYGTGYYSTKPPQNPLNRDYIITNFSADSNSKSVFIDQLQGSLCSQNNNNLCISDSLKSVWERFLTIPVCYVEGSDCYIDFDISAELFSIIQNSSDLDSNVNSLLNAFFIDFDNTVQLIVKGVPISAKTALFGQSVIGLSSYLNCSSLAVSNSDNTGSVLMTVRIRTKVLRFSASLIAYFSSSYPDIISVVGQKMMADTDLVPLLYYNSLSDSAKLALVQSNCDTVYIGSSAQPISVSTFQNYILNKNSGICLCYCSKLVPIDNQMQCGNKSAMCFDNACTDDYLAILGVSDCELDCPQTCAWAGSSDANGFSDPSQFNSTKFSLTCGYNCNSILNPTVNIIIPILGTIFTILIALLVFSICKYYDYSSSAITLIIVIITVINLGLVVFFSSDFRCLGRCGGEDGKTFQCLTKHTKMVVPDQFCSNKLLCECQFGVAGDCGQGCTCVSTMCTPIDGSARPSKEVYKRDPNIIIIVMCFIISIIIPIILIYLHDDYHWNMSVWTYSGLVGVIALIPFSIGVYELIRKKKFTVFDQSCK